MIDLVPYIQAQLKKGYHLSVIRDFLIKYGHSNDDIERAIEKIVDSENSTPLETNSKLTISVETMVILSILTVFFLSGLAIIIKEMWIPEFKPSQLLDLETLPAESVIEYGDNLMLKISIFNFGMESRYDVVLYHELFDMNGNIMTKKTETIAVETRTTLESEMQLLPNVAPGEYFVRTYTYYNDQIAESEFKFIIMNNENWKKYENQIYDEKNQKIQTCSDDDDKDFCYYEYAITSKIPEMCLYIEDDSISDKCFMYYVAEHVFSVNQGSLCDYIHNNESIKICELLKGEFS